MRKLQVKAIAVLFMGVAGLTDDGQAEAAPVMYCNHPIGSLCHEMSHDEIRAVCNTECPTWEVAVCLSSGNIVCVADEM